jgi:hypothetical protein
LRAAVSVGSSPGRSRGREWASGGKEVADDDDDDDDDDGPFSRGGRRASLTSAEATTTYPCLRVGPHLVFGKDAETTSALEGCVLGSGSESGGRGRERGARRGV